MKGAGRFPTPSIFVGRGVPLISPIQNAIRHPVQKGFFPKNVGMSQRALLPRRPSRTW